MAKELVVGTYEPLQHSHGIQYISVHDNEVWLYVQTAYLVI